MLDNNHASSYEWLGFLYTNKGLLEEAIVENKRAIEIDPTNRRVQASLAAAYRKLGREAECEQQLRIVRQLKVQPTEDEYMQANIEALCGNADEAVRLLKIALDKGQRPREFARDDSDFDFIKEDLRFKALVEEGEKNPSPSKQTDGAGDNSSRSH
jgi:Flp pilus assembly protein TadD